MKLFKMSLNLGRRKVLNFQKVFFSNIHRIVLNILHIFFKSYEEIKSSYWILIEKKTILFLTSSKINVIDIILIIALYNFR